MRTIATILLSATFTSPTVAQPPLPHLEPVARIGCVDCSGPTLFASIQSIALMGGIIYVLDQTPPLVRVFAVDGRTIRAFASRGDGPGEFRLPIALAPRANGEMEVFDLTQRRFTRLDSAGRSVATRPIAGFSALAVSAPGGAHFWLLQTDFRSTEQPLLRVADGGTQTTPAVTLKDDFPRLGPGEHARTPAMAADMRGGFAVGDGIAEYRIRRYDEHGRSLGDIVRAIPRERKTAEELATERERMQMRAARLADMLGAEGGRGVPATFTPREERNHFNMDALAFDDTNRLWVRTERGGPHATIFDLFAPDGRYIGEVRTEQRAGAFAVHGAHLVAAVTDESEVPFVQVWRVR